MEYLITTIILYLHATNAINPDYQKVAFLYLVSEFIKTIIMDQLK